MENYKNNTPQEMLQVKQRYLRTNVIDNGYDPQQFVSFCIQKYGQIDLQQWQLEKLSHIVQQYITSFKKESQQPKELENISNEDEQWNDYEAETIKQSNVQNVQQQKPSKQIVFSDADWDIFLGAGNNTVKKNQPKNIARKQSTSKKEDSFNNFNFSNEPKNIVKEAQVIKQSKKTSKEQQKKQAQENSLSNTQKTSTIVPAQQVKKQKSKKQVKKIEFEKYAHKFIKLQTNKIKQLTPLPPISDISIIKTQQITKNFFQGDYTVYHILLRPCQHIFVRKFNDFRRLRIILTKFYPTMKFPYIEPEGWLVNASQGKDQQLLSKYKWMIIQFLKFILIRSDELKNSKLIRQFIGINSKTQADKDYLKKIFDEFQHVPKPKLIGQLKFKKSQLLIKPNPIYTKQINSHLSLMPQIDVLYDKIKKQLDIIHYNYDILFKSFTDLIGTFDNLEGLVNQHFKENYQKEIRVYEGFKQICTKLQNNLNDHNVMFKAKLGNMFKYEKENMFTIKEIFDTRNKISSQFNRHNCPDPLATSTTEILYVQSAISIQQPCRNNKNTLSIQNTFWQHICAEQINKYWDSLRMKINQQITLIAYEQLDMENDNLNFWNTLVKKCVL